MASRAERRAKRGATATTQGDLTFSSSPIIPTPPKNYGIEAPPPPRPSPQPVPDPIKPLPPEELQGDPLTTPGTVSIEQNPERYKRVGNEWQIQAEPQIAPLVLVNGVRPELKPVLRANGIILKVGDEYLCSKRTLADILNSGNPHYDVAQNGMVKGAPIGRSVPLIELDISGLGEKTKVRDEINAFAGVKSVDYTTESELEPGTNIPKALLYQINYTLVEAIERAPDDYEVWDMLASMQGDYSIRSLVTATAQEENKLDKEKLAAFMEGLAERLKIIRKDFNMLKAIYYNGQAPTGTVPVLKFRKVARAVDDDDDRRKNRVVIKTTEIIGLEDNPLIKLTGELDKGIKGLKGDLGELKGSPSTTKTGAGDQSAALIRKWQSYKWTQEEAEYLKRESVRGVENPPVVVSRNRRQSDRLILDWLGYEMGERIVGFDHIRWTPAMEQKAAIVVPLPKKWGSSSFSRTTPNPIIEPAEESVLIRLYGTPPNYRPGSNTTNTIVNNRNELWWMEQNAKRQAEIVRLAYDIRKIETETGKSVPNVQPPGVTIGGQAVGSLGRAFGSRGGR